MRKAQFCPRLLLRETILIGDRRNLRAAMLATSHLGHADKPCGVSYLLSTGRAQQAVFPEALPLNSEGQDEESDEGGEDGDCCYNLNPERGLRAINIKRKPRQTGQNPNHGCEEEEYPARFLPVECLASGGELIERHDWPRRAIVALLRPRKQKPPFSHEEAKHVPKYPGQRHAARRPAPHPIVPTMMPVAQLCAPLPAPIPAPSPAAGIPSCRK